MEGRGKIARSRFRPDEDNILRLLVLQFGTDAWSDIANRMPGRNVRQCRDRWSHYLAESPVSWTPTESVILHQMIPGIELRREPLPWQYPDTGPPELPAPLPCPAEPQADLGSPASLADWSCDALFPRNLSTDVAGVGEEFWMTPMRDAWSPDFL
jgi:hypothetical protein